MDIASHGEKFLRFVMEQMLESPEQYTLERVEDEMGVLYKVYVEKPEMGKVIGKAGKHVESLKTLLKVIGSKTGTRLSLKVMERE